MGEHDVVLDQIINFLWLGFLAVLGGLLRFLQGKFNGDRPIDWTSGQLYVEALMELALSAFAGIIAFYVCKEVGTSDNILAVSVAIAGHQGGRAIEFFREYIGKKP